MDQQLKERVVGAAVLVAVAVLFIPMILSGPPQRDDMGAERTVRQETRPEASDEGFSSRIVPLGDAARTMTGGGPKAESATPAVAEPAPAAPPASPPSKPTAPATTARVDPAEQPRKQAKPAPGPAPKRSGWVVQLGSFSNPRNAYALRDRLKSEGYATFAVTSRTGTEAVTRVYVGPEPARARAEGHVAKLLEKTRLKGIVVRYPDPGT